MYRGKWENNNLKDLKENKRFGDFSEIGFLFSFGWSCQEIFGRTSVKLAELLYACTSSCSVRSECEGIKILNHPVCK